jgi:hypothetical protein
MEQALQKGNRGIPSGVVWKRGRTPSAADERIRNPERTVFRETTREVDMAEMTQVLRRLRGRPRRVGRMEYRRADPAATTAASVEWIARKLELAVDGQPDFQADLETKVSQWDELIPGAEVGKLRYVAELTGGSASSVNILLF